MNLDNICWEHFQKRVLVGDGHSLYEPSYYDEVGFSDDFLPVAVHESGYHYKETIFVKGKPVRQLKAVHHLSLLWKIAKEIEADTKTAGRMMGRGFQASALCTAIREKLVELDVLQGDTNGDT